MVPGETTVQTSLSVQQSALRTVSGEYCDIAVNEGWVKTSGGLAGLADTLINGAGANDPAKDTYAARIGAETRAPALVLAQIVSDTQSARTGLVKVSREAKAVLATNEKKAATRADVMSYERALVRAQMAYRSFQTALGEVAARPDMDMDTAPVDRELEEFASTIDAARDTADTLADKYAKIDSRTS